MTARKIDPQGKHLLFDQHPRAAADTVGIGNRKTGKDALYSTGPRQPGTVLVRCSKCKAQARTTLLDLGVRMLSVSVWIPGRRHSHWMRCPSCHEHTWCAIGWND